MLLVALLLCARWLGHCISCFPVELKSKLLSTYMAFQFLVRVCIVVIIFETDYAKFLFFSPLFTHQ